MKTVKKTFAVILFFLICVTNVSAQSSQNQNFPAGSTQGTTEMNENVRPVQIPNVAIQITEPQSGKEVAFSVRLLLILTILTIAPSLLLLVTCFLRFSIVLDFIKRALSLQQVPPTSILQGIAAFMTLFIMWPTFTTMYEKAYKPLSNGEQLPPLFCLLPPLQRDDVRQESRQYWHHRHSVSDDPRPGLCPDTL